MSDVTPSRLKGAQFRTVRKGYDTSEVDAMLADAATALEAAQQQATAMEARARAAVARLKEVEDQPPPEDPDPPVHLDTESISRTLLLAQQTADRAISEAATEAARLVDEARAEADALLGSAREESAQIIDEARAVARKTADGERVAAAEEVEALKARREFLLNDVDQLERFMIDERDRLRSAARRLDELCERIPDGLGAVNRPLMSAADDDPVSGRSSGQESSGGSDAGASDGDSTDVVMPPEAQMPFADAATLAEALAGSETPFGEDADGALAVASADDDHDRAD